jgi:hypothetical protein
MPTVFWDSVAARIYEQRQRAFRCITNDLGETHRFRIEQRTLLGICVASDGRLDAVFKPAFSSSPNVQASSENTAPHDRH